MYTNIMSLYRIAIIIDNIVLGYKPATVRKLISINLFKGVFWCMVTWWFRPRYH